MKRITVLAALICAILALTTGCSTTFYKATQSQNMMGTTVTITLVDTNANKARAAIITAFDRMKKIETTMSIYDNKSEITKLNRKKKLTDASEDLLTVIEESLKYSKMSDGAFDITVQPILDLFTKTYTELNRPPTEKEIETQRNRIDYRQVQVENKTITIGNMTIITLGGIAKGYAIDKAIESLQERGISRALVDAGGNLRAIGKKTAEEPWIVALQNPRNNSDYITMIKLEDESVATSGDYVRYFDKNKTAHHIINPKTGTSATDLISATVITKKAMEADALSTTVFVLGPEKGLKLIESMNWTSALLITRDRKIIRSSRFKY
ncbi:MAG: FAD:protein FMN transferase [Candidatus Woesearchaeota archaeon]